MRACPESTSWTQYKVAQAYVVVFKPWSNENCTEACSICIWHPGANEVKELEQSASVSLSVAYALRCPWPTILSCSPLVHEGSPKCRMGTTATPNLLAWSKQDKEYLITSEGLKTLCSKCRGGREGHAVNELWIHTVLQHGSHPSLHGVCRLRLLCRAPQCTTGLGRARGCCWAQPAAGGGQIPLAWKHQARVMF